MVEPLADVLHLLAVAGVGGQALGEGDRLGEGVAGIGQMSRKLKVSSDRADGVVDPPMTATRVLARPTRLITRSNCSVAAYRAASVRSAFWVGVDGSIAAATRSYRLSKSSVSRL